MVIVDRKYPVGSVVKTMYDEYATVTRPARTYGRETWINVKWAGDDFRSMEPADEFTPVN